MTMLSRYGLLTTGLLASLTLVACGGGMAEPMAMQGTAEDEATLRGLAGTFTAAWNAGDAAALGALATDDYQTVEPDGTHVTGPAGLQQYQAAAHTARTEAGLSLMLSATTDYVSWINAENAVIGGSWTVTGAPEGSASSGSWLVVSQKGADGMWRMKSSLAADHLPPPAMPDGE